MSSRRPFLLLRISFPGRPIFIQLPPESFITKGKSVFQENLREMERKLLENSTKGDLYEVPRLISCQMVDVNNVQHLWDTTPLCEAAKKGHTDIVRVLLDRGADPNNSGTNCIKIGLPGKSILGDYFQKNMTSQRLFFLLRICFPGRPIFIQLPPDINKMTPLHFAVSKSVKDVVRELELHIAVFKYKKDVVQELLDRGANPNMEETVGRMTPLHMAALASGDLHEIQDIFKLLIHAGADLNKGDKIGETPLHKAARRGYTTVVIDP